MSNAVRLAKIAALTAVVALPVSLAGCTDEGASPEAGPASSATAQSPIPSASGRAAPRQPDDRISDAPGTSASPSMSTSAAPADAPFGPACSALPTSGKGSFGEMSSDRVATAAESNPMLSRLVAAVKAAGLMDTLNNAEDITVFAPTDDAFQSMDQSTMRRMMANPERLSGVLQAHVVSGRITPNELTGEHQTLNNNARITVTGSGEEFTVNRTASVVCGNIQTANATLYLIDDVLLPDS